MAERSPFERAFNPDYSGSLTGFLGGLMGHKTTDERHGELRSKAMETFSRLQTEQGMDPQRAFLETIKTPEGMALFSSGAPDALKSFSDAVQTATPPPPTVMNTPAGTTSTAFDRFGKPVIQRSQGTTEMQQFDYYKSLAKLPDERVRQLAELQMIPQEDRKFAAIKQMVKDGQLTDDEGTQLSKLLISDKAIQVHDIKGAFGESTGNFVVIDTTGQKPPQMIRSKTLGNTGVTPAAPITDENPKGIADPKRLSMFNGAGFWPSSLAYLTSSTESLFGPTVGTKEGRDARADQLMLNELHTAVTSFPEVVGRSNKVIESFHKLLPSNWGSPLAAVSAGIEMRHRSESEIARLKNVIEDDSGYTAPDVKKAASREIGGYQRIIATLPPMQDMLTYRESVMRDGTAPAGMQSPLNAKSGIEGVLNIGKAGASAAQRAVQGQAPEGTAPQQQTQAPQPQPTAPSPQAPAQAGQVGNIAQMSLVQLQQLLEKLQAGQIQLTPQQNEQARARLMEFRQQYQQRRAREIPN